AVLAFVFRFYATIPDINGAQYLRETTHQAKEALASQARLRPWLRCVAALYPLVWALLPIMLGFSVGNKIFALQEKNSVEIAKWLGLVVAMLNAGAVALIYLREKFAIEPEVRNYKEMVRVFYLADKLLKQTSNRDQQCDVLLELGREALAENAYWLRAHQE